LNRDVASALRDILVIKTCSNAGEVLGLPQDKLKELEALSQKTNVHALLRAIEIFSVAEADLKYSTHPKIVFETAAVKASLPQADYNIDALMARISTLEKKLEEGDFVVKAQPQAAVVPAQPQTVVEKVVEKPIEKTVEKVPPIIEEKPKKVEAPKKVETPKKVEEKLITEAQRKRLFAIGKNSQEIIREVLQKHGYDKTEQIKMSEYNDICKEIEDIINTF
jgi:DNA polymerase III gamma/tau subunit